MIRIHRNNFLQTWKDYVKGFDIVKCGFEVARFHRQHKKQIMMYALHGFNINS